MDLASGLANRPGAAAELAVEDSRPAEAAALENGAPDGDTGSPGGEAQLALQDAAAEADANAAPQAAEPSSGPPPAAPAGGSKKMSKDPNAPVVSHDLAQRNKKGPQLSTTLAPMIDDPRDK